MNKTDKEKIIEFLQKEIFPKYQQELNKNQELIITELAKHNLEPTQFINGLIGGMSYTSFELSSKLAVSLIIALLDTNELSELELSEKLSSIKFC